MKVSKKILGFVSLLLVAVVLVACNGGKDDRKAPTFTGVGAVTLQVGATFDPLEGVAATDHDGNDLTEDIVVVENTVNTAEEGNYTVKYEVTDSKDLKGTATRAVTVGGPVDDKLYANGSFNFRFAESDLRHTFFAAAEGYLLDNVAGGVPLFINSGSAVYASRVQLPTENFVPVMGWGSAFGTLTQDDSTVTFSGGKVGEAGKFTYRGAFSSNPTTFNQWISDDSVSSDAADLMLDSLYKFVFNDDFTAYEVAPSMASDNPNPLNEEELESGLIVATKWSVPVREGLKWKFHPETNATGLKTDIDAQDFVDTFRFALENDWFRARAGGGHFWAASNTIVGAQDYYNYIKDNPEATKAQKDAEWQKVGFKVVENAIEFTFASQLSEWNVKYWLSSNTMSPVHLGMIARDGVKNYARTPQEMAFTGPYYLHEYEADKVLDYRTNENYHNRDLYNYDGFYYVIIERAEIIFAEFEAGNLDGAGIPLTKFEQYRDNPGLRRTPGSTTFRMNINGLGSVEAQQEQFPSGLGFDWVPEPILSNVNMKRALYWVIDRETLAWDILKTSDPGQFYFSDAYLVDPQTGTAFRQTPQGQALGEKYSPDTYGFNEDLAKNYFETAVKELMAEGKVAANQVIELDLSIQAGSASQAQLGEFVKNAIESTFNNNEWNIKFDITIDPVTFPDNYYARTIVGRFDLGTGGISGSTLDAASFLEVFSSDNRGGFTIDWGFDTSIANIPVTYTLNGETVENEYWSFDAIVSVLNGPVTVADGREVLDTVAIQEVNDLIAALPAAKDYVHDTHQAAVVAAYNAYWSLLPRAQESVVGYNLVVELIALRDEEIDKRDEAAALADAVAAIAAAPAFDDVATTEAEKELLVEAFEAFNGLSAANKAKVENVAALEHAVAKLINLLVAELPALGTLTLDDAAAVAEVAALNKALGKLVSVYDVRTIAAAESRIAVLKVDKLIAEMLLDDAGVQRETDTVKLADRYEIQDVRAAFNKLTKSEQLTVANATRLTDWEAAVKPLVDEEEAFLWTLTVLGLPDANDIRNVHVVQVEAAIKAYNKLTDEAKAITKEFTVGSGENEVKLTVAGQIEVLEELMDIISDILDPELKLVKPE